MSIKASKGEEQWQEITIHTKEYQRRTNRTLIDKKRHLKSIASSTT
jgi:hypothetical protein